jgi:2-polyprenyl-3-methyl-5-hydroxy-6-metoxy-1,4-benzoquinol methylase
MDHIFRGVILTPEQIKNHRIRHHNVLEILKQNEVKNVIDVGSCEGRFLKVLLEDGSFTAVVGVDPDEEELAKAQKKLLDFIDDGKLQLIPKSIFDLDKSYKGYDAVTLIETIEHFSENDLQKLSEKIFFDLSPSVVVITTPRAEPRKTPQQMAELGHFFEWNTEELETWAKIIGDKFSYKSHITILSGPTFKRGCQVATFIKSR